MQWFANFKTGTKITLSFSVIILIMIFIAVIFYNIISKMEHHNENTDTLYVPMLENLTELKNLQGELETKILLMIAEQNPNKLENVKNDIKLISDKINQDNQNIIKLIEDPVLIKKFTEISTIQEEISNIQLNQMIPLLISGKIEEAKRIYEEKVSLSYDKISAITVDLITDIRNIIKQSIKQINNEVKTVNFIIVSLGIIAILIVFALTYLLNNLIAKPLTEISKASQDISMGNLTIPKLKSATREDEVGILANNFQKMIENLHNLTREITDGIMSLETSANEISSSTAELSSSSSETATAISETTTTIEEVKQTSQLANQKAKQISENAQKTSDVSSHGKRAANEINEVTNNIQNQMNLIADSMLRLSEQNQAIGTIIASVEDMTQQSNLLSVNASIEAAKAGEHGKGFAIVAQEVKTLANQSKQATNQIRDILNDIQKATNAAVLATEQGSKSVESAVKKTSDTSNSILTLVTTVSESSKDAMQIAATAHQQLVGMEQTALAMGNIKQATFQNVEGTKQLEIAAKNIKQLGQKLKQLISFYKLKKSE